MKIQVSGEQKETREKKSELQHDKHTYIEVIKNTALKAFIQFVLLWITQRITAPKWEIIVFYFYHH